jgi:hypothetical protein
VADRPPVDPAKVIDALDVCRAAPAGRRATFDYARTKGFTDLPPERKSRIPSGYEVLVRDGVWLRPSEPNLSWGSGGSCTVLAPIPAEVTYDQVTAELDRKFGIAGVVEHPKSDKAKSWRIDGRYYNARIISGELTLFMSYPVPTSEAIAAAKDEEKRKEAAAQAARKAAIVPAPPADFGAAAAACVAAIGPAGLDLAKLDALGWQAIPLGAKAEGNYFAYQRPGNAVRLYLSTEITKKGQCVAEGNNPATGQFGAIAGAVKKDAATALGTKLKGTGSSSSPTGYSRGEGYLAGDTVVLVSSESRPEAMNVRVLVMRIDLAKGTGAFAREAGMAAAVLPDAIAGMISDTKSPPLSSTPQQ